MLEWGTDYFEEHGIDSPRLSIEWLVAHVLGLKRLDIYLQFNRPLSSKELNALRPLIKRRAAHEPLQYITGSTEFMGCRIEVNPNVLIPRQETEQLVEIILEKNETQKEKNLSVLDIGTGSGCIPIALKKFAPAWQCTAIDISHEALDTARHNAEINDTEVIFIEFDLFALNKNDVFKWSTPDIVVSNPPYITPDEIENLDPQVKDYEPPLALFNDNPLQIYENIARFAAHHKSALYLECNDLLTEEISEVVHQYFNTIEIVKDLDLSDRFVIAFNPSK